MSCVRACKNKAATFELRLFTIYLQNFKIKNLIFFEKYDIIYIENKNSTKFKREKKENCYEQEGN